MPAGVPATAVSDAGDMTDEDLVGPSGCPFGQRVGGWMIQVPAALCSQLAHTARNICCGAVCDQLHIQPTTRQPAPY